MFYVFFLLIHIRPNTFYIYICRCGTWETSWDVSNLTEDTTCPWSSGSGHRRRGFDPESRGHFPRDPRLCSAGWRTNGIPAPHGGSSKSDPPNLETLSVCSHMLSWAPCELALRIYTTPIFWETYRLQMYLRRLCIFLTFMWHTLCKHFNIYIYTYLFLDGSFFTCDDDL